jgi:hypothetical protein
MKNSYSYKMKCLVKCLDPECRDVNGEGQIEVPLDPTRAVDLKEYLPCRCLWSCDARVITLDAVGGRFLLSVAFYEPGGSATFDGEAADLEGGYLWSPWVEIVAPRGS